MILRICFFNGFIFLMATFMDIWLLCRSLDCARDDNWRIALFLRLVSYLWNVGSLFVRLFSYFYNDSPIVISTGGSFCFRSGEIFLKAMGLLVFIFLMATFMDISLLCRSLGYARDDNWRIALFLELLSFLLYTKFLVYKI